MVLRSISTARRWGFAYTFWRISEWVFRACERRLMIVQKLYHSFRATYHQQPSRTLFLTNYHLAQHIHVMSEAQYRYHPCQSHWTLPPSSRLAFHPSQAVVSTLNPFSHLTLCVSLAISKKTPRPLFLHRTRPSLTVLITSQQVHK